MKTIVFDFDKTLTYKDSLTQFFIERMKGWRIIFLPYYVLLKVLSKFKIISVLREKELAMAVLFPKNQLELDKLLIDFASRIELNPLNDKVVGVLNNGNEVIILSASPEIYLKELYPQCQVIGMQIKVNNGIQITQHPYGDEKIKCLLNRGVTEIDEMYYDSESDESLLPICKKSYKVKNGIVVEKK